ILQPLFGGRGDLHFAGSFSLSSVLVILLIFTLGFPFCGLAPAQAANEQIAINNVIQMKCLYIKYLVFLLQNPTNKIRALLFQWGEETSGFGSSLQTGISSADQIQFLNSAKGSR